MVCLGLFYSIVGLWKCLLVGASGVWGLVFGFIMPVMRWMWVGGFII